MCNWSSPQSTARPTHEAPEVLEHFLQPGEVVFGGRQLRLRTLLGSCVALVLWHPQRLLGGMCHYMLPGRHTSRPGRPDGRYATEALALLLTFIRQSGTRPEQFTVSVFGGGDMFPSVRRQGGVGIGELNVHAARRFIQANGLRCEVYHVGGQGYRSLVFDVASGRLQLNHTDSTPVQVGPLRSRTR
ncbi:chemotaxis protein CheD [Pseudomonas gingeri]|uniref:Probable chemoreceptor glutamine deamidase CheD n=1 Tax=Pseudomonas gingeri TaxID=117681 RepID=A0A7Y7YFZ6_9PSED|nr:chemotaxis protein CheD [Pseudomonas gingeri]NWC35786.1 chemotaxis protein CheD [Pseudomonas gingeri]NWD06334.1 chemotaxis protein CheD [Pseudomonas gingeri]NWE32827.1 chemotaxis protein CheD [Pseudomonas gingeri]NWE60440.1 chemotaxis protein CheD [Pseudomonas gingeri]